MATAINDPSIGDSNCGPRRNGVAAMTSRSGGRCLAHLVVLLVMFAIVVPSARAQYVGGETVYHEPDRKPGEEIIEHPAPGIRLYLIAGAYDKRKGLPPEAKRLDEDFSASTHAGDSFEDRATYVLISPETKHSEVTVLFYPWSPKGAPISSGLLSRVVTVRVTQKDQLLRGKARLVCDPTNGTLTEGKGVAAAAQRAYIAHEFAKVLDYNPDVRRDILLKELVIISSMIDAKNRPEIVDRATSEISKDPLLFRIAPELVEILNRDKSFQADVRNQELTKWDAFRRIDPSKRSFDAFPR